MGFFSSVFRKKKEQVTTYPIRDTLFGDMPLDQWQCEGLASDAFPWSEFALARSYLAAGRLEAAINCWRQILEHTNLESRHYLQSWNFLRKHGQKPSPDTAKLVLGVVIEVMMPEGLDMLAVYSDHSARYYNYSGSAVVWEHQDTSLDSAIDQLLAASSQVVTQIGPWEQERPAPPPRGHVRLSFLTPSGLHFGEGAFAALSRDPLGGRVLNIGTSLMKVLISKAKTT
jgi:tetratricopeptide (TPR) repeat protein